MKKAEKKQGTRSSLAQSSSNKLDADPKKIFVGGFGDKITNDDLSGYFEKFGTIMMLLCVMINKQERQGASDLSTSIPRKLRTRFWRTSFTT